MLRAIHSETIAIHSESMAGSVLQTVMSRGQNAITVAIDEYIGSIKSYKVTPSYPLTPPFEQPSCQFGQFGID